MNKVDDAHTATVTASLAGSSPGTTTVQVIDNENRNLNLVLFYTTLVEGSAPVPSGGYVSLSGSTPTPVVITLSSNDISELEVPTSVTINAGSSTVVRGK